LLVVLALECARILLTAVLPLTSLVCALVPITSNVALRLHQIALVNAKTIHFLAVVVTLLDSVLDPIILSVAVEEVLHLPHLLLEELVAPSQMPNGIVLTLVARVTSARVAVNQITSVQSLLPARLPLLA